jgi:hypothetical protein
MSEFSLVKTPGEVKHRSFKWETWLAGDTIATSTFSVEGPDSSLTATDGGNSTTLTNVWISGGALGLQYKVINTIITASGRKEDECVSVLVQPC